MITSWHNGITSIYSVRYDTGGASGIEKIVDNSEVIVNRPNNGSNIVVSLTSGLTAVVSIMYISNPM